MSESLTGQGINVSHACRVLGVSESGYYSWKGRPASPTRSRPRSTLEPSRSRQRKRPGGSSASSPKSSTASPTDATGSPARSTRVFVSHPQAPVLMSIPGIGARTGARILTEIADINRFPTAGHLAAYAGLAPVTRQSGSSIRGEHRSRRGNHRLKNAMWLSAFCSLHHNRSRDYYARKRSEGKLHNAAVVCLARRRCDVIHAMLRTGLTHGELPGPARPAREAEIAIAA